MLSVVIVRSIIDNAISVKYVIVSFYGVFIFILSFIPLMLENNYIRHTELWSPTYMINFRDSNICLLVTCIHFLICSVFDSDTNLFKLTTEKLFRCFFVCICIVSSLLLINYINEIPMQHVIIIIYFARNIGFSILMNLILTCQDSSSITVSVLLTGGLSFSTAQFFHLLFISLTTYDWKFSFLGLAYLFYALSIASYLSGLILWYIRSDPAISNNKRIRDVKRSHSFFYICMMLGNIIFVTALITRERNISETAYVYLVPFSYFLSFIIFLITVSGHYRLYQTSVANKVLHRMVPYIIRILLKF